MVPPKYRFIIYPNRLDTKMSAGYKLGTVEDQPYQSPGYSCTAPISPARLFENSLITALPHVNCNITVVEYASSENVENIWRGHSSELKNYRPENINAIQYIRIEFDKEYSDCTKLIAIGGYEAEPHYKQLSKVYEKESGQEFFRTKLEGKLTLFGKDFEKVYNASIESKFALVLEKYSPEEGLWEDDYFGEFTQVDCKFNIDAKSCELKLTPIDTYNEVLNKYDNTYDLIKLAPALTKIRITKRPLIQAYLKGSNSIGNFLGGTYWESEVTEVIDKHDDLVNKYYFARANRFMEIEVSGATTYPEVNQTYTGAFTNDNGTDISCITGDSSYKFIVEDAGGGQYNYYIIRASDNTKLYQCLFKNGHPYDIITSNSIGMVPYNGTKIEFTLKNCGLNQDVYSRVLCDVNTYSTGSSTINTYDIPADDFAGEIYAYKKCIGITGGNFVMTAYTTSTPTKYGINDNTGEYFTNKFLAFNSIRPLPVCKSGWGNAAVWYIYHNIASYEIWEKALRKEYTLKDSFAIADAIKSLLTKIDPSLTHEATSAYSEFLYGTNNAGISNAAQRFYLSIAPKSNILKGEYDQPAQKAETTLEEIMNMLRDCFRCYWFIDSQNRFRIEHISYFNNGLSYTGTPQIQLNFENSMIDSFNKKPVAYFQSEIEYDKSELSSRYEFSWMDDVTELFSGTTIDVKSNYIDSSKTEDISLSQFSSDIDYMLLNPTAFSDDGFAILCAYKTANYFYLPVTSIQFIDSEGFHVDAIGQNLLASWRFLINYYMYDMPATNIEITEGLMPESYKVEEVKFCKKHSLEFLLENDPNLYKLVHTKLGDGRIDKVSINLPTRKVSLDLKYSPLN